MKYKTEMIMIITGSILLSLGLTSSYSIIQKNNEDEFTTYKEASVEKRKAFESALKESQETGLYKTKPYWDYKVAIDADPETGCEYVIYWNKGGITPRLDKTGKQMGCY